MKRLACAFAGCALLIGTLGASTSVNAPADEYFGHFKYSAISIRTKIDALGRAYKARWESDDSIVHDADLVNASYKAWAAKYPRDTWLAPTSYHLAQLYYGVQSSSARSRARTEFAYVARAFPKTTEGKASRLRIAQGYPALRKETAVRPTPSPYGTHPPAAAAAPSAAANTTTAPAAQPAPSSSASGG